LIDCSGVDAAAEFEARAIEQRRKNDLVLPTFWRDSFHQILEQLATL
jgi:hypothetical protein